jgi:hypothetical protein
MTRSMYGFGRQELRYNYEISSVPFLCVNLDSGIALILILNNLSHAHTLREVLDSEGVRVLYDADW